MLHHHLAEALERTLRDIRDDPRPFDGVTVVFAGDWAQTLPVVVNGSDAEIIASTLLYANF